MSAPRADRDHSEQPRTIRLPQGFADHFGIPADYHVVPTPSTATAGSDPTQGTPRSVSARVVRASEAQVEAALDTMRQPIPTWEEAARAVADAVVAAGVDADEVTRLRRWKAEATEVILGLQDLGKALGLPLGERITGTAAAQAAASLVAERDRLAEVVAQGREELAIQTAQTQAAATKVARVEALAKHITEGHRELPQPHGPWTRGYAAAIRNVLRALSGPSSAHTPATDAPQGSGATNGAPGQSGTGQALGGAEKGPWSARCDVPNCGWRSLPFRSRSVADAIACEHWEATGHGFTIGADR